MATWTIDPSTLTQLVTTTLPPWETISSLFQLGIHQPDEYEPGAVLDDFSPEGKVALRIVPFHELDAIIHNGDVVLFMEPHTILTHDDFPKQRGWHVELAFRNADGRAVQCAPWGDEGDPKTIKDTLCSGIANATRFTNDITANRMNLHIFRIAESTGTGDQIGRLLEGVTKWRTILNTYRFPQTSGSSSWFADPLEFENLEELENFARQLIRQEKTPTMLCSQWVHAVLSLALNVPLNRKTLTDLSVIDSYSDKWPQLAFSDDALTPLGRLPVKPYSHTALSSEICALYLGMQDPPKQILDLLNDAFNRSNIPASSVFPIFPFSEYRKPDHAGNVQWEYVASAFPDNNCIPEIPIANPINAA